MKEISAIKSLNEIILPTDLAGWSGIAGIKFYVKLLNYFL